MKDNYQRTEDLIKGYNTKLTLLENKKIMLKSIRNGGARAVPTDEVRTSRTFKFYSETEEQGITLAQLRNDIDDITREILIIENALRVLTFKERQVIEMFYWLGFSWERISIRINYTERHCKRIRTNAIHKMKNCIYKE
jgi:DNA-directed RNA polymerase specialized sigma24 family protein